MRLELTGRCSLRCVYCHAGHLNNPELFKDELPLERLLRLVDEAKEMGINEFTITGGEPFLNLGWPQVIESCGEGSRVHISTNGEHFTEENVRIIHSLPQVREIRTSLDGFESNDRVRKGNSGRRTLETLKRLRREFPDKGLMVQTTCYRQNMSELESLYDELKEVGITRWRLSQLWKTELSEINKGQVDYADYDEMFHVYKKVITRFQADGRPFRLGIYNVYDSDITSEDYVDMDLNVHPCKYQYRYLCVKTNGNLIFCPALNIPMGSVRGMSIREALAKSQWLDNFGKLTVDSVQCAGCRYIKLCGGGCRADALGWFSKMNAIDPNSCCLMVRVEKEIIPMLSPDEQAAYNRLIDRDGNLPVARGKNILEAVEVAKCEKVN
ncbi:MAG: radical SAM protein [Candidatus Pacebacteria bacterium]|nr:radical SAM protein [Candidatus Paceibacterota bacterium]